MGALLLRSVGEGACMQGNLGVGGERYVREMVSEFIGINQN